MKTATLITAIAFCILSCGAMEKVDNDHKPAPVKVTIYSTEHGVGYGYE